MTPDSLKSYYQTSWIARLLFPKALKFYLISHESMDYRLDFYMAFEKSVGGFLKWLFKKTLGALSKSPSYQAYQAFMTYVWPEDQKAGHFAELIRKMEHTQSTEPLLWVLHALATEGIKLDSYSFDCLLTKPKADILDIIQALKVIQTSDLKDTISVKPELLVYWLIEPTQTTDVLNKSIQDLNANYFYTSSLSQAFSSTEGVSRTVEFMNVLAKMQSHQGIVSSEDTAPDFRDAEGRPIRSAQEALQRAVFSHPHPEQVLDSWCEENQRFLKLRGWVDACLDTAENGVRNHIYFLREQLSKYPNLDTIPDSTLQLVVKEAFLQRGWCPEKGCSDELYRPALFEVLSELKEPRFALSWETIDALLMIFNTHYVKGWKALLTGIQLAIEENRLDDVLSMAEKGKLFQALPRLKQYDFLPPRLSWKEIVLLELHKKTDDYYSNLQQFMTLRPETWRDFMPFIPNEVKNLVAVNKSGVLETESIQEYLRYLNSEKIILDSYDAIKSRCMPLYHAGFLNGPQRCTVKEMHLFCASNPFASPLSIILILLARKPKEEFPFLHQDECWTLGSAIDASRYIEMGKTLFRQMKGREAYCPFKCQSFNLDEINADSLQILNQQTQPMDGLVLHVRLDKEGTAQAIAEKMSMFLQSENCPYGLHPYLEFDWNAPVQPKQLLQNLSQRPEIETALIKHGVPVGLNLEYIDETLDKTYCEPAVKDTVAWLAFFNKRKQVLPASTGVARLPFDVVHLIGTFVFRYQVDVPVEKVLRTMVCVAPKNLIQGRLFPSKDKKSTTPPKDCQASAQPSL